MEGAQNVGPRTLGGRPDMRRQGRAILPDRWPSFEQIATAIKDRDESATDRAAAREQLKALGLDPDGWK